MENYIVKVSVEANSEEAYETFKGKVEDLAKGMNINLVLNNECNCTSDYDENLCIRAFTCEDCVHYENGGCSAWDGMVDSISEADDCNHAYPLDLACVRDLHCVADGVPTGMKLRITPVDVLADWDDFTLQKIVMDAAKIYTPFQDFLKDHLFSEEDWVLTDIGC